MSAEVVRPETPDKTPAEIRRAATALREHVSMQEDMQDWKKIPGHEHPRLTSEPDDPALDAQRGKAKGA